MPTVDDVASVLLKRCGPAMDVVGMALTPADGTNPDLADAILVAASGVGIRPAGVTFVASADLADVSGGRWERLLDLGERRVLQTVFDRFLFVDQSAGSVKKFNDQFRAGLLARIADLTARLKRPYGGAGAAVTILDDDPIPRHRGWSWPVGWPPECH